MHKTVFFFAFIGILHQACTMQQKAIEADRCSICLEKFEQEDRLIVHGEQLFQVPPCSKKHAHHDICMAQLLHVKRLNTCCPLCRAKLQDRPAVDLAPLSQAVFLFIHGCSPHEIYRVCRESSPQALYEAAMHAGIDLPPPPINLQHLLFDAVSAGNVDRVREFLQCNVDVNVIDPESGKTALIIAAETGNAELARMLIVEGHADCTIRDKQNYSALMYAARAGHVDIVEILRDKTPQDQKNEAFKLGYRFRSIVKLLKPYYEDAGDTLIHVGCAAARDGIDDVVSYLCDGVDDGMPFVDESGFTPLMHAARNGHMNIVRLLVEHGDEVLLWNKQDMTARALAQSNGHTAIAEFLASHEPQMPSARACPIDHLLFAARTRDLTTVKHILEQHPQLINMRDNKWYTPLMCAVVAGDEHMVRFLGTHGANIQAYDYHNFSFPLALAIEFRKLPIVRILVEECGARLTVMDNDGDDIRAEKFAQECGYEEIAQYLQVQRANQRAGHRPQRALITPDFGTLGILFREAAENGDIELIRQLVHDYPDLVNEPEDEGGKTAFLEAISFGDIELIKLLGPYANINYKNPQIRNETALFYAGAKLAIVEYLVKELHADITLQNSDGKTARDIAVDHPEIVHFLDNPHQPATHQQSASLFYESRRDRRRDLILKAIYDQDGSILRQLIDCAHIDLERQYTHWNEHVTPLVFAVRQKKLPVVKWLLRNAPFSESQRSQALIEAVGNNNLPIVQFLISVGCSSNVFGESDRFGNNGLTALMIAARNGDMPIVQELILHAHADTNTIYRNTLSGRSVTAYDIARNHTHHEVAEFLAQHGGRSAADLVPATDETQPLIPKKHAEHCCTLL